MKITILNTIGELKSFPLTQTIKVSFEKAVEDSQLIDCITLIRLPSETGLFNISETYNQSIGYIREKFDIEEVKFTYQVEPDNSFTVFIKPVRPLSPGFEYLLFVDKKLSGIQAVQTLSRLNRCAYGKEDTFSLGGVFD